MINLNLLEWSDTDLEVLTEQVRAERERRAILARTPTNISALLAAQTTAYLDARDLVGVYATDPTSPIIPGWVQPTGAHDSYPKDYEVTHNAKTWVSLAAANVWEPGVSNWREKTATSTTPPEWVQPTGATDAYNIGDKVTFNGLVYESTIAANVWNPTAYPAGWRQV